MAIVVHCPGCRVRLTLGDDSAGSAMCCPRCGVGIAVPGRPPASPTPRPPAPSHPPPTRPARSSPAHGDGLPDPEPAHRPRRPTGSGVPLRLAPLVIVVVVASLGVWGVAGRPREAGGERGVGRDPAVTPADGGRAVERRIVGTWAVVEADPGRRVRAEGRATYNADGTFRQTARVTEFDPHAGPTAIDVSFGGTWRVQGDRLISKVDKETWTHPFLPVTAFFPDGKIVEGWTYSEEVVSVSDTHLITKDPETGRESVAERVP